MKLQLYSADIRDTCSFFRCLGPYSLLQKQVKGLELAIDNECSWATIKQADMMCFQRAFDPMHVKVLAHYAKAKVPVILDYDDLLHDLPPYNPFYELYHKPEVQEALATLPKLASAITVTTPYLAAQFPDYLDKVCVIPNAWDDSVYSIIQHPIPNNKALRVLWRGSPTHHSDLDLYARPCLELQRAFPDSQWFFLGDKPYFTRQMDPDRTHIYPNPVDILEFPDYMASFKPDIIVVPLQDNPFNRSKSNNAWMEATYTGAIVIAPDFEEWKRPGIVNYKEGELLQTLENTMNNIGAMRDYPIESWNYILENLLLSKVNIMRFRLLQHLYSQRVVVPPITVTTQHCTPPE